MAKEGVCDSADCMSQENVRIPIPRQEKDYLIGKPTKKKEILHFK